ncbi:MAG: flippase-like domain-containing protein [Chitinophagales bacterium]|nr:flippase-like domain-containing protein [Chitinophagales bacterium]
MNKNIVSVLRIVLFLAIGLVLFWLVIKNQNINEIREKLKHANWWWALLSLVFAFFSNIFRALRWNMLIEPLGYKPKLKNTFGAVMIGYLANLALPRLGEVSRSAVLSGYEKMPVNKVFGTVVVERIIDVATIFFLLFVTVLLEFEKMSAFSNQYVIAPLENKLTVLFTQALLFYLITGVVIVVILLVSWLLWTRLKSSKYYLKLGGMVRGFIDGIKTVGKLKNRNLFLLYTFLIWFLYFLMSYVCFFSFSATSHLGWIAALATMVFGGFGWAAPVQGGFGAFHALVTQTLVLFGIAEDDGLAFAILSHSTQVFGMLTFGLLSLVILPFINKKSPHELP